MTDKYKDLKAFRDLGEDEKMKFSALRAVQAQLSRRGLSMSETAQLLRRLNKLEIECFELSQKMEEKKDPDSFHECPECGTIHKKGAAK